MAFNAPMTLCPLDNFFFISVLKKPSILIVLIKKCYKRFILGSYSGVPLENVDLRKPKF